MRRLDDLLGGIGFHQHGLAARVVSLPQLRYRKTPGRALDEAHTEAFFQQCNTPTEFRFGYAKRSPGLREAAVIQHLNVVIQVV